MPIRDLYGQVARATHLNLPRVRVKSRGSRGPSEEQKQRYFLQQQLAIAKEERQQFKMMADLANREKQQKFEKEKWIVNTWTEAINKAKSEGNVALQENLISKARWFINDLSDESYALMKPHISAGPFDPMKQKLQKFEEFNPPPKITADPQEQPLAYAQQLFQVEDWEAHKAGFMTGKTPIKRKLVQLDDTHFALRDKDGRVSLATEETLQLQAFADKFDVPVGQVIADGGAYGTERIVVANGYKTKYRSFVSYPDREVINPETGEKQQLFSRSVVTTGQDLTTAERQRRSRKEKTHEEFLANWGLEDTKSELVKQVKRLDESGVPFGQISEMVLKPVTGMNYRLVKAEEKRGFWAGLAKIGGGLTNWVTARSWDYAEIDDDTMLIAFPGDKITIGKSKDGKPMSVFYDQEADAVYDGDGVYYGTLKEAIKRGLAEGDIKELDNMFKDLL